MERASRRANSTICAFVPSRCIRGIVALACWRMIDEIRIQNFKSIRDVTVKLEPVTVFVGRSGTGKSNFLAAIRFLRDFLSSDLDAAANRAGGWSYVAPVNDPKPALRIEVSFRLDGYTDPFRYMVELVAQDPNQLHSRVTGEEQLNLGDSLVFSRGRHQWKSPPSVVTAPQLGTAPILGSLPTLSEAVLAYTALTSGIGVYDFPAWIFGTEFSSRAKTTSSEGLSDGGGNYLAVLQALTRDLRDQHSRKTIIGRLRQLNASVRSIELNSIQNPTAVVVGHEFGGKRLGLQLAQESDGFRRFYAHMLALFQTPPKQLLMFEEPENGIYPGALEMLAEEFKSAPSAKRGQVILTTHSPGLLDHFEAEAIRVVQLDEQSAATLIAPLAPDQRESIQQHLLHPGELLTTDEARIARATSTGAG